MSSPFTIWNLRERHIPFITADEIFIERVNCYGGVDLVIYVDNYYSHELHYESQKDCDEDRVRMMARGLTIWKDNYLSN